MKIWILPAVLVLLTLDAAAQQVVPFQGERPDAAWKVPVDDPGPFGRGVSGNFTGDDVPDVVQLDGSRAVLLTNADEFFSASDMAAGVTDLATLPGGGGALDALAVVGPGGLELVAYDPLLDDFQRQTLDASAWAGARLVRAADLNGDGVVDLIGVAADGQTVLMLYAAGAGFVPAAGFVANASVRDLLVLPWDADAPVEVALLTDLAVDVHDLDGVHLKGFSAATPGGAFCAIGQAGVATRRIAWITEYAPGSVQLLAVLQPSGVSDVVDLGALDAFAVVPHDHDLDGDDDILISHRYSYELLWIENERSPASPSGPTFQQAGDQVVFQVEAPGPAPQNQAWPVVDDLDGDGDQDVAFASDGSARHMVFRGEPVDQRAFKFDLAGADFALPGGQGRLSLKLGAPAAIPADATHLELRVWRRPSLSEPVDTNVLAIVRQPLPSAWPAAVDVDLPETDTDFETVYDLHLRLVGVDGAGNTATAHPATKAAFTLLASDRAALQAEEVSPSIPVTLPMAPEPIQDPCITRRKRSRLPPPSGGSVGVLKFE